jgi:uncharacterized protein YbjT (DUF2867 family)
MKIVIIGGTGLIGRKLTTALSAQGHTVVPASPDTGVNTLTGEGLAEVLVGADTVVDLSNSPSFADDDVLEFFTTSTQNLLAAELKAGVGHHVILSIVGADRLPDSGYMRAKVAQEQLVQKGQVPFTIVHSTQFFEFSRAIVDAATTGDRVHLPTGLMQPIAADDVVAALARIVPLAPLEGTVEIGGPEKISQADLGRRILAADGDSSRTVVEDPHAKYFGTELDENSLVPGPEARLGTITLAEWLATTGAHRA